MKYLAVFKDREISDQYKSEERLHNANRFRWDNLYRVLTIADGMNVDQIIKETLREIPRVR